MDWQFGDVFLAMCVFFAWVVWFWLLITVFGDLFRRHDIGGGAKAGWTIFVIVLPFLGCFIYLITQGRHMAERRAADMASQKAEFDEYVRRTAGNGSPASEIEQARRLLDAGAITEEEFASIKARALSA